MKNLCKSYFYVITFVNLSKATKHYSKLHVVIMTKTKS
jgi:hypothetical protein